MSEDTKHAIKGEVLREELYIGYQRDLELKAKRLREVDNVAAWHRRQKLLQDHDLAHLEQNMAEKEEHLGLARRETAAFERIADALEDIKEHGIQVYKP